MSEIEKIRDLMPEAAKDIRLNLQSVLQTSTLNKEQVWGTALASAYSSRNIDLTTAIQDEASKNVSAEVVDDAKAAAALMAMNNIYYRFRHMIGKEIYETKRAGLRMNRIAQPLSNKTDFELFCLAVSAINGCEYCIRSHEGVVLEGGLTEDQVHDAVRIAAVINAAAVSLEISNI